jgi:hypothetical protein
MLGREVLWRILGPERERNCQENRENYTARSFIICTAHQILRVVKAG